MFSVSTHRYFLCSTLSLCISLEVLGEWAAGPARGDHTHTRLAFSVLALAALVRLMSVPSSQVVCRFIFYFIYVCTMYNHVRSK